MSTGQKESKREDALGWDEYFMGIAFLSAKRSKDPRTQVGACIVNKQKRICGTGYNGMPDGCSDNKFSWDHDDKQLYVCHADMNAVLNKNSADVRGCTIYTSHFPCNECAKVIIQAGIDEVVYCFDKKKGEKKYEAARKMFRHAGVSKRQYTLENPLIIMKVEDEESSSSHVTQPRKREHKKQKRSKKQSENDSDEEDSNSGDDSDKGTTNRERKKRKDRD